MYMHGLAISVTGCLCHDSVALAADPGLTHTCSSMGLWCIQFSLSLCVTTSVHTASKLSSFLALS